MPTLGNRLKSERERLGFSQTRLADLCGVVLRSQRNYEKDERQPDATYLSAAATVGMDVLYILTGQRTASDLPDRLETKATRLMRQAEASGKGDALLKVMEAMMDAMEPKGVQDSRMKKVA